MRRTKTTRTRTKSETRNPRRKTSPFSLSENEMKSFGLFASSSTYTTSSSTSSSSSNLSPLALPFTVERSNYNTNFNLGTNSTDSNFNFNGKSDGLGFWSSSQNFQTSTTSQGLSAESIRTATVPSTYSSFSNPNPKITITSPNTHNRSIGPNQLVIDASFSSDCTSSSAHNRSSVPAVNVSAIGPSQPATGASFSMAFGATSTHNWSSMNSSVKSGLEPVDSPSGYVFGANPNTQSNKWSSGNVGSDNGMPSRSWFQDYGSSQVSYSQSLSGSKHSGSQGKQDSSLFGASFGRHVTTENNIGLFNEHAFRCNDSKPHYYFESRPVLYDTSSGHTSPLFKDKISVSHDTLKEKEVHQAVGFEYKSSLSSQVPDINSTEEVNSGAHVSEHLDHHNPGEDSPCWKGDPTHFSSSGSQEQESMKKLQSNSASGEDLLLHMDQSLHETVEKDANVVTSESLDVNMIVKALNNLSELLLCQYSRDECRLKEQDHKALDHVIANLNVCMSSQIQQVNPAQKCSPPQQITSNAINDEYGKKIEELQSAYNIRNEGLPKDYNMVQKIKMVLDENMELKEDLPPDPVLYKDLWLEAEAELCVSSYKARLHRARREMDKSKALGLSDTKKMSSSNFSPTAPIIQLHESKILKPHAPTNISLPIVDDIDNSVMARFNILKLREQSIPVDVAEKQSADVEASGNKTQSADVAKESHLKHLLDTDEAVLVHTHGNLKMRGPLATEDDVDHAVLARLNILKSRGELDPVNNAHVSEEGMGKSMMQQSQFGSYNASSLGWEYVDGWMNRADYEQA